MKLYSKEIYDYSTHSWVTLITDTPITDCEGDGDCYCDGCGTTVYYSNCFEYKDKFYCTDCIIDAVKESKNKQ